MPAMAARRGSAAAAWIPIFLLPLLAAPALGDIYLHSPRGSNNKLNEVSNQATNENRLFDSQNNARGGYQVGDACPGPCLNATGSYDPTLPGAGKGTMEFYAGSELRIEWTAQHGSGPGNPNVESKIVLQYACEDSMPGLRDGTNTSTVPEAALAEPSQLRYGQHEAFEFWDACRTRERNRGLFTADQRLGGDTARYTRQNPAGTRYGFECAEERWVPYRDGCCLRC
ncbi:hypothetical protein DFJ74DRAFT_691632 [Hyaloraphidium curvatum]|nr:hypothetical protein DFJ74DRAFT_691632 [Hyaloraphidium curvatum]